MTATQSYPLITLTTDFGLADTYVGVMKGVIFNIVPHARLVDLTHAIAPQNILEASVRLEGAFSFFPPGTVHLVVVDPGVGSERDAVVVQTASYLFIAPDNGVLTYPLRVSPAQRIVRLKQKASLLFRHPVSTTFHGRDVFAPIAAHLAAGLPLDALEDDILEDDIAESRSLVSLPVAEPHTGCDGQGCPTLKLTVLYSDHFGNLITNLTRAFWEAWRNENAANAETAAASIACGNTRWSGISATFAAVDAGKPLAYWGSSGRLEIGIRNGNARRALIVDRADPVLLTLTLC